MSEKLEIPIELQTSVQEEPMNFKDLSFLVSKYIYKHPLCSKYTYNEYKESDDKISMHDEYSKQLKKIKTVFKVFGIEKYFTINQTIGGKFPPRNKKAIEKYRFTNPEAIFYYELFYRMENNDDVWKKITNVKNEEYQGFIEKYYKCADKKRFIEEIDFFIEKVVKLYLETLIEKNIDICEAKQNASALEEHLLFSTQRLTINLLERVNYINFSPSTKNNKISIKRWLDYKRYLKQLYYYGCNVIDGINKEFLSYHPVTENTKSYNLVIDTYKDYLDYEEQYEEKVNKELEEINSFNLNDEIENTIDGETNIAIEKMILNFNSMANEELQDMLNKLLLQLKQLNPEDYSNVTCKDLLNPYTTDVTHQKDLLPISFPTDLMAALLALKEWERIIIFSYYNDYIDFTNIN